MPARPSRRAPHPIRLLAVAIALATAAPAAAMKIDDFKTATQSLNATIPGPNSSHKTGAGMLGGERDLLITLTSGASTSIVVGSDLMDYAQSADAFATGSVIWDGVDGSSAVDSTGLGGLDFTEGGAHNAFFLSIKNTNKAAEVTFTVWSSPTDVSVATVPLKPGQNKIPIFFDDFVSVSGFGADFMDVGALSMSLDGDLLSGLTTSFDPLETRFQAVPEPSTGLLFGIGLAFLGLHSPSTRGMGASRCGNPRTAAQVRDRGPGSKIRI